MTEEQIYKWIWHVSPFNVSHINDRPGKLKYKIPGKNWYIDEWGCCYSYEHYGDNKMMWIYQWCTEPNAQYVK